MKGFHQLAASREHLLGRLPAGQALSPRLEIALRHALQEAELERSFSQQRQHLYERYPEPMKRASEMLQLESKYHQARRLLGAAPELNLEERDLLLQALMRSAAEQYIEPLQKKSA